MTEEQEAEEMSVNVSNLQRVKSKKDSEIEAITKIKIIMQKIERKHLRTERK